MSAKPTEQKPEKKVDEVADQLSEATIDEAERKKREKKLRQKAKKEAEKAAGGDTKPEAAKNGENNENGEVKSKKNKKSNKKSGGGGPKTQTDPPSVPISGTIFRILTHRKRQATIPFNFQNCFQMATFPKAKSWTTLLPMMIAKPSRDSLAKKHELLIAPNSICITKSDKLPKLIGKLDNIFKSGQNQE